jgi:uncharacterized cupin superfamily protein
MRDRLIDDIAYDDNPEVFLKVVILDIFNDKEFIDRKKLITGYLEAPVGSYNIIFRDFNEIAYIIKGEMELTSKDIKNTVKKGDYYYCKIGEKFKVNIKNPVRIFFVLSGVNKNTAGIFEKKKIH